MTIQKDKQDLFIFLTFDPMKAIILMVEDHGIGLDDIAI